MGSRLHDQVAGHSWDLENDLSVRDIKVDGDRPDIGLARSVLGWEPDVPIREGLARTVSYLESEVNRRER